MLVDVLATVVDGIRGMVDVTDVEVGGSLTLDVVDVTVVLVDVECATVVVVAGVMDKRPLQMRGARLRPELRGRCR